MSGGVFISYRRSDSAAFAGRLADYFDFQMPDVRVFFDLVAIEPGEDFVEALRTRIASSEVVLVMIGEGWLNAVDGQGRRRLDDPADFVRLEVANALAMGTRVIPVLLDAAQMPGEDQLPGDLKPLARCNAEFIRGAAFRRDGEHLAGFVRDFLERSTRTVTAPPQAEARKSGSTVRDGLFAAIDAYMQTATEGSFITIESPAGHVLQFAWDGEGSGMDEIALNLPVGDLPPARAAIARQMLTESYSAHNPMDEEDFVMLFLPPDASILTRTTLDIFEHVFGELPDAPFRTEVEV